MKKNFVELFTKVVNHDCKSTIKVKLTALFIKV